MARPQRSPPPPRLPFPNRSGGIRSRTESPRPKKIPAKGETIGPILAAYHRVWSQTHERSHKIYAVERLIALCGTTRPHELTALHAMRLAAPTYLTPITQFKRNAAMQQLLRLLADEHGATPGLDRKVPQLIKPKPRNTVVSNDERQRLMTAAPPHLQLLIRLAGDLGLRSGTAFRIAPEHYDPERETLTLRTKFNTAQTLPVTPAITALLQHARLDDPRPFITQLHPQGRIGPVTLQASLRRLAARVGITRQITPHDLRRTLAVNVYQATGDLRAVQATLGHRTLETTLHYLDHDSTPVNRAMLTALAASHERKIK